MNTLDYICIAIAVLSLTAAMIAILVTRHRSRTLIESLDKMLDSAMDGAFSETSFNESLFSSVEAKLAHYLYTCEASSKNLSVEKDKIKELISDISHQTKTPIANILLYAQLLGEKKLPEDCESCVNALSSQAEKLSFLIGSLVKTSRLETGIVSLNPKLSDLDRTISSVAAQISPKAQLKNIQLSYDEDSQLAFFDVKWTSEALFNILDNAVKYTPEGGKIGISIIPYQLFCRIDISDTGIGISEHEQSKVFARFYRSPAVSSFEGVGLGLYLAREIISGQGGYIKLSSTPEKGSVFSVFLPMSES